MIKRPFSFAVGLWLIILGTVAHRSYLEHAVTDDSGFAVLTSLFGVFLVWTSIKL